MDMPNICNVLIHILLIFSPLTAAGPTDRAAPTPTTAGQESRVLSPGALVTDTTGRYYLTLLSAPLDQQNPNPGTQYVHDDTSGSGITIFIIDSGFNIADFPDEFCTEGGRWIETRILSRDLRSAPLTDDQLAQGVKFPPNTMIDVGGIGEDNLIHGHGTQVAIIAGGCQSGVAPRANLFLVKAAEIKVDRDGDPYSSDEPDIYPQAIISALQLVVGQIDDSDASPSVSRGKVVVSVSLGIPVDEIKERWGDTAYNAFRDTLTDKLNQLNERGVTVVFAAGNDGKGRGEEDAGPDVEPDETPHYADENFPHELASEDSNIILVGGTDENGRLRPQTSPGRDDHPITLYAPSRLPGYDLADGETEKSLYGTSFSCPQVAGLAAYLLALPSESDRFKYGPQDPADNTVGMRVKKRLVELAYQRLSDEHKLAAPQDEYDYDIPSVINVVYNGAHGPQTP